MTVSTGDDVPIGEGVVDIDGFNALRDEAASSLLESCLAVQAWIDEVLAGRPYDGVADLLATARASATSLTAEQVESALARHPRIGETAGDGHDKEFSEQEQSAFDRDDSELVAAMNRGNAAYESQFGRVFLIRAAGRSADEILAELRRRLANTPEDELPEVIRELGEIAVLRLRSLVEGEYEQSVGDNDVDTKPPPGRQP